MEINDFAAAALDALHEGITIINREGVIVFVNRAYRRFLSEELGEIGEIVGRKLRDIRPGAQLTHVMEQGIPAQHVTRQESQDIYFVNMYPILEETEVLGGISVVTFLKDAYQFRDQLEEVERRSKQVLRRINKANGAKYTFDDIIAVAPQTVAVKELAKRIAATDATVLLNSESGTGKEIYAQAIHNASRRQNGVFVTINCANFNANLLESELFGYVEGAFTGAKKHGKIGLFEAASGGTIFLDEISEMDIGLQAKLLRALQERKVRPVGGIEEVEVDVRVIAACNADLQNYVEEGRFRKDLYYRLSTFPLHIPPLREREEDIPDLCTAFLAELSKKMRRQFSLTEQAIQSLQLHHWPGNVRELYNVLEFCAVLSPDGCISMELLPAEVTHLDEEQEGTPLSTRVKRFEQHEIKKALIKHGYNLAGKKKAAKELGISLASLYNKLNADYF